MAFQSAVSGRVRRPRRVGPRDAHLGNRRGAQGEREGGDLTAFLGGGGDATGDGIDDLVASTPDNGTVYFFRSEGAAPDGSGVAFAFPTLTFASGFGTSFAALFGSARPIF
jgi:hypothetical protein